MSIQLPDGSIDRPGIFPQPMQDQMYRPEKYLTADPNAVSGPSGYTLQQYEQPYAAQQYEQPYAAQYAPQQYAPPQMFFEPGAINDASVNAALAILNRSPVNQYQALTPEMYNNFYAPPLSANTAAYAGLGVPDYNDPNSKYLPPPPPPPAAPAAVVARPLSGGGGDGGYDGGGFGGGGGFSMGESATGAAIGAAPSDGIDMGVDGGLGGPSGGSSGGGIGATGDAGLGGPSGGGGGGGGKIICTAMNHAYGFGSFRNAIWIKYADKHLTKAHEVGYHTLFLPLVDFGFKRGDGKINLVVRKVLEWGTRHRSTDLRAELRNKKRDTTGRIIRLIFEPLCYAVGKLKGY